MLHPLHAFRGRMNSHQAPVTGWWVVHLSKVTVYSQCYLHGSITETLCVCFRSCLQTVLQLLSVNIPLS